MTLRKTCRILGSLLGALFRSRNLGIRLEPKPLDEGLDKKTECIQHILDIEWQMFSRLREPDSNESDHGEKLYRAMRRKIHSVLPEIVLESYLQDLREAQREGRNLIMDKFDRREGKRIPLRVHPLIPRIVELECGWETSASPNTRRFEFARNEEALRLYITSELETYSDRTLYLYYRAVLEARRAGRNLLGERYGNNPPPRSPER